MAQGMVLKEELVFKPVTINEWEDLQTLFSQFGTYSGCWCMWWRITQSQFTKQYREGNKNALENIIKSGEVPGILAYYEKQPIG